jgi:membrane-associated phospholipid phosphatase
LARVYFMDETEKSMKQLPVKFLLASVLFIAAVIIFSILGKVVVIEKNHAFDDRVFYFLRSHTSRSLVHVMDTITFFGSTTFLLPAYIGLVSWLLFRKKNRWAIDISIVGLSGELMKQILKNSFQRKRPDLPLLESLQSYSFPSGHALSSFILCSSIIYLLWHGSYKPFWRWTLSILLILFSLFIGLSRIVLRYHYASDVIAGFCMGFAWVMLCLWLLNWYNKKKKPMEEEGEI